MPSQDLTTATPSTALLNKLVDHPHLPALVAKLKTPALTRLIATLGVEDAGPVIAHTTTQQLQRVFDEMLWQSLTPDSIERMSAEAFVQWLQVLLELGDSFVAERLESLGLQFAVAQLAQLLEVHDLRDTLTVVDENAEAFGNYRVLAKSPEDWDVLRGVLVATATEVPDFLSTVLANVATTVRFGAIDRTADLASVDEAQDRDVRREQDGFVTKHGALEFLNTARTQPLDTLADMAQYSQPVARYLATQSESAQASSSVTELERSGIAELTLLLDEVNRVDKTLRLESSGARKLPIKELLDQLEQSDPDLFEARLAELVYLGNVLVAGSADLGERFNEIEAANAALSTANLGAAYLVSQKQIEIDALLKLAPGLVRAFAVGWHILHQIAGRTARALVATLRAPEVRQQLAQRQWILAEVDVALANFVNSVDLAKFNDVREALTFASLVIEPDALARLQILISEFPRLPLDSVPGVKVKVNARHFDSLDDLQEVDGFIQTLSALIKL